MYKNVEFYILARRQITDACLFVFLFVCCFFVCLLFCLFVRGDRIDPVVLECCKRAHSNENEKF